jgi:hypothetical protein
MYDLPLKFVDDGCFQPDHENGIIQTEKDVPIAVPILCRNEPSMPLNST